MSHRRKKRGQVLGAVKSVHADEARIDGEAAANGANNAIHHAENGNCGQALRALGHANRILGAAISHEMQSEARIKEVAKGDRAVGRAESAMARFCVRKK